MDQTQQAGAGRWKTLYTIAGWASVVMVAIIPLQIGIFIAYPPPTTVTGFFSLFQESCLLGLLSMDLLYILNNTLLAIIYLGLYRALKKGHEALLAIALTLGMLGIAAYYASNTAFEMLALSNQYAAATSEVQRAMFLAAGQAMLAIYTGTAFDTYYVLNALALLIIAGVMLRSPAFSKATALTGLLAGILMSVPSTAGTPGMIFALASLVPWTVFAVLIARRFFQLAHGL
jgi:hypothetical protein